MREGVCWRTHMLMNNLFGVYFRLMKDRTAAQRQFMIGFWWDSVNRTTQCGIFTGISTFPKTLALATQTQSGIIPVYTIFSRSETSRAPQALAPRRSRAAERKIFGLWKGGFSRFTWKMKSRPISRGHSTFLKYPILSQTFFTKFCIVSDCVQIPLDRSRK